MARPSLLDTVLVSLVLVLSAPALAQDGAAMQLLGVSPDSPSAGGAGEATAAVTAGAAGPAASCQLPVSTRAELVGRLHEGGQKRRIALIVRGAKFGIHPFVQSYMGRLARAFGGDPNVRQLLERDLNRSYLSDEAQVESQLAEMGYEVKVLTSAELGDGLKDAVKTALADERTSMMVFYGHGCPDWILLSGEREHSAPGPDELEDMIRGRHREGVGLSPDELLAARRGKKLDALLFQCCQGGQMDYLDPSTANWGQCVAENTGFLAAWVTYAVYLTPRTREMLDAYFCHAAAVMANAPAGELRRSSRFYKKSAGLLRTFALLAGLDDERSFAVRGGNFERFEADPAVHPHVESTIAAAGALNVVADFVYNLKYGKGSLAGDLASFLTAYQAYCDANGVRTDRGDGAPPRLSAQPTADETNRMIAYHLKPAVIEGLEALAPGFVVLRHGRVHLDPSDPARLFVSVDLDVNDAAQIDQILGVVSGAHLGTAVTTVTGSVPGGVGQQLASRIRTTIASVRQRLPGVLASIRLELALDKVVRTEKWEEVDRGGEKVTRRAVNRFVPDVIGYNVAIGQVAAAVRDRSRSPYQLHVSLDSASSLVSTALTGMLGDEIELRQTVDPGRFSPSFTVYAYLKLHSVGAIRATGERSVELPLEWQLRVNWGSLIGNGHAYVSTRVRATVETSGDLGVKFSPGVSVKLGSGWPAPAFIKDPVANRAEQMIRDRLQEIGQRGIDLGALFPAEVAGRVVGHVRIGAIEIADGVVSITFDRVEPSRVD